MIYFKSFQINSIQFKHYSSDAENQYLFCYNEIKKLESVRSHIRLIVSLSLKMMIKDDK